MRSKKVENEQDIATTDAVAFYKKQARLSEVDDWKFHLECFVNAWAEEEGEG